MKRAQIQKYRTTWWKDLSLIKTLLKIHNSGIAFMSCGMCVYVLEIEINSFTWAYFLIIMLLFSVKNNNNNHVIVVEYPLI